MTLNGKCEKGPITSAAHPFGGGGGGGGGREGSYNDQLCNIGPFSY